MKMKVVACLAFLLNAVLFGTYYAISKEVLGRIDPIVFSFFEMIILLPAAHLHSHPCPTPDHKSLDQARRASGQ